MSNSINKSKTLITSQPVLTHYNPDLLVRLASDASPNGISGILSHVMPDSSGKPIAFASRSLTKTERNYAQTNLKVSPYFGQFDNSTHFCMVENLHSVQIANQ